MRKKRDPNPLHARLPCGRKVKIKSIDGNTATVMRLGGLRRGTLAVCAVARLGLQSPGDTIGPVRTAEAKTQV